MTEYFDYLRHSDEDENLSHDEYNQEMFGADTLYESSMELSMFMDWFDTCMNWENITPSRLHRDYARDRWYPGKAPADAANEVIKEFELENS